MKNKSPISGIIAMIMCAAFALITTFISIANFYTDEPLILTIEIIIPYLFITLTLFIRYVFTRLEQVYMTEEKILARPVQGVEIFRTSDEFIKRLAEVTVIAEEVCTLNLSPPRGVQPQLDDYFKKVHKYIKTKNSQLKSFRSIAKIENRTKAEWLLKRSLELVESGKASQAMFPINHELLIPLGFHIVLTNGGKDIYVFFYPPVSTTGIMESFLLNNKAIGDVMIKYFDLMWANAQGIHFGRSVKADGLESLSKEFTGIEKIEEFVLLEKKIL